MKKLNFKLVGALAILMPVFLTSCLNDKYEEVTNDLVYSNFDFKTTQEVSVNLTTLGNTNQVLSGVYVELYTQNPVKADGTLLENSNDYLIFKGVTNSSGKLSCKIAPATSADSLTVLVNYVGLPHEVTCKMEKTISLTIGGSSSVASSQVTGQSRVVAALPEPTKVSGYYVLGSWNSSGLPKYLWTPNDVISADFLADVNASLPEREKLTSSHPEYLSANSEGSVVLIEDAEVWVTFVHEGAGNLNGLGYYTFPTDTKPASVNAITDATIIFPNASYSGSGGALVSGNKVQLLYLDKQTMKYTTVFPAGTTVAWFLKANGFSGGNILKNSTSYYSDIRFNPESTAANRIHNVLLKDNARKLLLLGFEDLNRDGGSDDDFNDAVFYTTVTPYTAVKSDFYQSIDTPKDTDGDGIGDSRDEYPNDKEKAFNNYYPAKDKVGSLAFEDLWPNKGDYDFNDLVVDYRFNQITNADNNVVEIAADLTVKAIGASFRNGFALQLNTLPENISSVTGQYLSKDLFKLAANGTEAAQQKAVIPVFDDAFKVLDYTGSLVNTVKGGTYVTPQSTSMVIKLKTPVALSGLGTPPYNPFIVLNGVRGREVHLAGYAPTSLVDESLFGTGDDNSVPASGKYYMSDKYLPWAINLPVEFDYPYEKQDITKSYLMFSPWAISKGINFTDWYVNSSGYRDDSKIFSK